MKAKQRIGLEISRLIRNNDKKLHPLRQLFWESTLRCNLKCRHCGSDCKLTSEMTPDMPLSDFLKVLDESVTPHVNPNEVLIIVSGGEPLMRDDLEECGMQFYKRGYPWGMVTNGLALTPQRFDSLLKSGLRSISVSLDGFEDDHNWMRGNPESFKRVLVAVEAMKQHPELTWDVITCVNQRTIKYLPQFRDYLIDLGIPKWRLFTVFPFGRAANEPDLKLSNAQFVEMMEFIKQTRLQGKLTADYGCDGFLGRYEGQVRSHYFSCSAGINIASVLADGSISGCLSIRNDYHQGNIYKDSFWEVWQNRFQPYRDRSWMKKDECAQCKVWRYCQGNGMHLRDGDGKLQLCQYKMITEAQ